MLFLFKTINVVSFDIRLFPYPLASCYMNEQKINYNKLGIVCLSLHFSFTYCNIVTMRLDTRAIIYLVFSQQY